MNTNMKLLDDAGIDVILREAHTYNGWQKREVSNEVLTALYDAAVMGPTSANCLPMRLVFVKSAAAKARLIPHMMEQNKEKTLHAPVTAIVGYDLEFYKEMPRLFPPVPEFGNMFKENAELAQEYAMRNGSLQGGYLIIAIRAFGLSAGPMSGFDNAGVDKEFFAGTACRSNFLCNIGYGDGATVYPRNPRLSFDEACSVL